MKKKILIAIFIIGITLLNKTYAQNTKIVENSSDIQIIGLIKKFYTDYITAQDKAPFNIKKLNLIEQKYCTPSFLKKLEKAQLDYDPFVNAQDYSIEWLKTITIKKDIKNKNLYIACYTDTYTNKPSCMRLVIIKSTEGFKIDNIIDPNLK